MTRIARTPPHADGEPRMSDPSLYKDRVRVYPRAVRGVARRVKWAVLVFCLVVYYALPWFRWTRGPGQTSQAVLLDIGHERFYFFAIEFWPQDIYYLTGALILAAVGLFLVTSLVGRAWCAYACPQTVWTDLFMRVERLIQGDRNARMKRDQGHTDFAKIWRKTATHAAWLGIAFWTGGAWIMYFADAPTVTRDFWRGTAAADVYVFTSLFTATTYVLAGWAREQVCTYMCPWPRFQASMLDEHSLIVTYESWRGEPRGHGKRPPALLGANQLGANQLGAKPLGANERGDCIDCSACVNVCPTGIDIRDGSQLECINCGLCIDACNEVMTKTGQPKWLVRWDTLANQEARAAGRPVPFHLLRPRTLIYIAALVVGFVVMGVALANRAQIDLAVEHDRAPLFVTLRNGSLRNAYTLKISNKTHEATAFAIGLNGIDGAALSLAEDSEDHLPHLTLTVAPDAIGTYRVLVFARPAKPLDAAQDLIFTARNARTGETAAYTSVFMGPTAHATR